MLRDFFMGSTVVVLGMLVSLIASVLFFVLWIFFHLVGVLACIFFFIFLFFFALWLIGFLYRKVRETAKT